MGELPKRSGVLQRLRTHQLSRGYALTWLGKVSCPERGVIATGAAIQLGATPLEALVIGHTAAHGAHCWITDSAQADLLLQRNGRHPHPRSVARARRNAASKGFLRVERVYPFQRPKGAKYRSGPGTTNKSANFSALRVRDPITRGQLRRIHARENAAERPRTLDMPVGPRLIDGRLVAAAQPRPVAPPRRDYLGEYQRMAAPAVEAAEQREQAWQEAADDRMLASIPPRRPPKPPPDE